MLQTLQEASMRAEHVNKAQAGAADRIMPGCVLLSVRNIKIRTHTLYVERSKATRDSLIIVENIFVQPYLLEIGVENVNAAAAEIGCQNKLLSVDFRDRGAFVDGAIRGAGHLGIIDFDHCVGRNSRVPTLNRAIFCHKDEHGGLARSQEKISRTSIEQDSCWRSRSLLARSVAYNHGSCAVNGDDVRVPCRINTVQRRSATGVVRYPPGRAARRGYQAPRILQIWIHNSWCRSACKTCNQIGLSVVLGRRQGGQQ